MKPMAKFDLPLQFMFIYFQLIDPYLFILHARTDPSYHLFFISVSFCFLYHSIDLFH